MQKQPQKSLRLAILYDVISMDIGERYYLNLMQKAKWKFPWGYFIRKISSDDLELIKSVKEGKKEHKAKKSNSIRMAKAMRISPELNIIGMHTAEAESVVEGYIDDAYLAHLPKITIIHGRGTGALRDLVADVCKGQNTCLLSELDGLVKETWE